MAFLRAVNKPARGLGPALIRDLQQEQKRLASRESVHVSLAAAGRRLLERGALSQSHAKSLRWFLDLLQQLHYGVASRNAAEAVLLVLEESGYADWLCGKRGQRREEQQQEVGQNGPHARSEEGDAGTAQAAEGRNDQGVDYFGFEGAAAAAGEATEPPDAGNVCCNACLTHFSAILSTQIHVAAKCHVVLEPTSKHKIWPDVPKLKP